MRPPLLAAALLIALQISATMAETCPYDIPYAATLIPPSCYRNYSDPATIAPQTSCCWFVFASFMYAVIRHANSSSVALLPEYSATSCVTAFSGYLLRQGLVRPSLLTSDSRCSFETSDQFVAGKRACQYSTMAELNSLLNLSSASSKCLTRELAVNQSSCSACQNSIISLTLGLLNTTRSKEFVPCGMAATIGIWAQLPELELFRSFVLCILQVLENIGVLGTSNLVPSPPPPSAGIQLPTSGKHHRKIYIAAFSASAAFAITASVILFLVLAKRFRKPKTVMAPGWGGTFTGGDWAGSSPESPLPTEGFYVFTKAELTTATNGFDRKLFLGEGGAGKVYLGKLPSGQEVAVKRISHQRKVGQFYREVELLAKFRHRNLTALLGYCPEKKEPLLVYEYMRGGSLARAMNQDRLSWRHRVRIAVDCAEGLAYLHDFHNGPVIHRDVNPTNILLTDSGDAKLSDFGVSKYRPLGVTHVSTEVMGTAGYLDPEYFFGGHVTEFADVYSFGVVMLELLCGRKTLETPSGGLEPLVCEAHVWAAPENLAGRRAIQRIVDPKLGPEINEVSMGEFLRVACTCVRRQGDQRPTMKQVLDALLGILKGLESDGSPGNLEVLTLKSPEKAEVISDGISISSTTSP
ncbi:hypothetical protein AMTRI_Chr08g210390 [Amborella trichopoda]